MEKVAVGVGIFSVLVFSLFGFYSWRTASAPEFDGALVDLGTMGTEGTIEGTEVSPSFIVNELFKKVDNTAKGFETVSQSEKDMTMLYGKLEYLEHLIKTQCAK